MLTIDPRSPLPPYEQLRVQVLEQVQRGELAAGTKLPSVRQLAADLVLAPNTVARAYRELESLGIVETHGRNGTTVSAQGDITAQRAQAAARTYADSIRKLGVSTDDALAWVTAALRD